MRSKYGIQTKKEKTTIQRYNDITQNRYKCEVQKIDRHETRGAKKKEQ